MHPAPTPGPTAAPPQLRTCASILVTVVFDICVGLSCLFCLPRPVVVAEVAAAAAAAAPAPARENVGRPLFVRTAEAPMMLALFMLRTETPPTSSTSCEMRHHQHHRLAALLRLSGGGGGGEGGGDSCRQLRAETPPTSSTCCTALLRLVVCLYR